ncbi:hypothetical protein H4219_003718 [Mycoemilia scoparia]|uniref:Uncharacterized protein n=1 Tax=Mycoemilia scoparia TaxID=417184 RepID=A0A9W8DSI7_9FUNG|nr:hypothetical protein H4219_003718 [Mycoemilia scoparia]
MKYTEACEMLKRYSQDVLDLLLKAETKTISASEYYDALKYLYGEQDYSPNKIYQKLIGLELGNLEAYKTGCLNPFVNMVCTSIVLTHSCNYKFAKLAAAGLSKGKRKFGDICELSAITKLYGIMTMLFTEDVIDTFDYTTRTFRGKFILQGNYDYKCACGAQLTASKAIMKHWLDTNCLQKWSRSSDEACCDTLEWVYTPRYLHESGCCFTDRKDIELYKRKLQKYDSTPKNGKQPKHQHEIDEFDNNDLGNGERLPPYPLDDAPFICMAVSDIKFKIPVILN